MLSNRALGNFCIIFGGLLLLPTLSAFVAGPYFLLGICRKDCWLYVILNDLFGPAITTAVGGLIWLALAISFATFGMKLRHRQ